MSGGYVTEGIFACHRFSASFLEDGTAFEFRGRRPLSSLFWEFLATGAVVFVDLKSEGRLTPRLFSLRLWLIEN